MIIQRKDYIDKINPFINKHIIKVLIGTRRSGKSTILKQIIDSLIKQGIPKENIVWMNFELSDYFEIDNIKKLEEFIANKTENIDGKIYLFFDEIQIVPQWEKLINSYFAKENYDIYLTGSNSKLLSGEFATYLSGRYVELNIYSFSLGNILITMKLLLILNLIFIDIWKMGVCLQHLTIVAMIKD